MTEYNETKDSNTKWLKRVPKHWDIHRLKHHLRFSELRDPGNSLVLSLYREYGIVPKDSRDDNHNATSDDTSNYRYVSKGDFVINKMKAWQGSVAVSDYDGIVSPAYYVYKFTDNCFSKRYFHYLMRNKAYAEEFRSLSGGIRIGQWDLPKSALENIPVLIPPQKEQSTIASYLDDQCGRIDSIIEEAKASIEEYKTWKASIICEAVTKGIDPTIEMKDSGAQWIGNIPEKWSTCRMKNCFTQRDGGAWGDDAKDNEEDLICLRIADFDYTKMSFKKDSEYTVRNYAPNTIEKLLLQKGDILIEKSGGGEKTPVGRAVIFDFEFPALFANFMDRLRCANNIDPKWMVYVLFAFYANGCIRNYIKQTTGIQNLNISAMLSMETIALPLINEKHEIAAFLNSKCTAIDGIILEKEGLITDLESYKKSIIYETVTGKRKVV